LFQTNDCVAIGNRLLEKFEWKKIDVTTEALSFGAKVYDSEQGIVYKFPTDLLAQNFYGSLNRRIAIPRGWEPRSGWAPSRGNPS
jgi:hypothetical protein